MAFIMTDDIGLHAVWNSMTTATAASDTTINTNTKTATVAGYVWPMAMIEMMPCVLVKHDIVVELRATFKTPATGNLQTTAVLTDTSTRTGRFTFENVQYGTYILYIKRLGYLFRTMMINISKSSGPVVTLAPPGTAENGVFNLWWGDCSGDFRVNNDDFSLIMELHKKGVNAFDPLYNPACNINEYIQHDNDNISLVLEMWDKMINKNNNKEI